MDTIWVRLARNEDGATAIEYGLIVAGIAIAILATVFALGNELNNVFNVIFTEVEPLARCVEVGSNCKK